MEIELSVIGKKYGEYEGKIFINHEEIQYTIPVLIHYTKGSISINQENEKLFFEINHPEKWSFAKISIINSKNGNTDTVTSTPHKKASLEIYENGEYWIDAKIKVGENTSDAFNTIKINSLSEKIDRLELGNIPEKQIILIISIVMIIGIVGLIIRK
jgi:minor extracellular serine protease Vpr